MYFIKSYVFSYILEKLPLIFSIVLFLLLYGLRTIQGGWEIKIDILKNERQAIDQQITNFLPSPQAELLSGIILGNRKDLPGQLLLSLRDTSTLHLVVVSGQNLSITAGFFLILSGLIGRKVAIIASFGTIIFYTILTGAQIPVLRAALMVTLSFLAAFLGRQKDGLWVLIVTGGLLLLISPKWLFDISFQLSFLATFGVVAVAPIIFSFLKFMPKFISGDLSVTIGAQLMVIPVIAGYFHQISLVGIIANLLVLWTIPYIMIIGILFILPALLWTGLAEVLALILNILLNYFIYIVQFFSSFPFAWEYVGEQVPLVWIGYYLMLGSLLAISKKWYD